MNAEKKIRVALGLSGGVDSSVAAALLLEQGYDVTGVYITCWSGPGCRSEEDRQDALDIALQLGIPFEHLDFQQTYKDKVYEYMIKEYELGRTPNPDVMCNREIKFGLFYEWAMKYGFDYVATGHYARISQESEVISQKSNNKNINISIDSRLKTQDFRLMRSVDEHKDQTYFLYQLRQDQLQHILFPIGHLTKTQVREEAIRRNLVTATKPDSVGICFIGEQPMGKFLSQRISFKEGKIVLKITPNSLSRVNQGINSKFKIQNNLNSSDNSLVVGSHKGVQFYTIGQRIAVSHIKPMIEFGFDMTHLPHFYVVDKDLQKNIIYVGTDDQLNKDRLTIGEIHWIGEAVNHNDLFVRIRHTGELIPINTFTVNQGKLVAQLGKPVRAPAPGQAAVFYDGKVCLGGGVII